MIELSRLGDLGLKPEVGTTVQGVNSRFACTLLPRDAAMLARSWES